jgi:prepilin-type N-terminal cleavage/methylation domain-containing protein
MRARRGAGFTLIELMIVVALIAITGMLAARLYSRGVRGESAPSFTRTLMSTVLEARHTALSMGRATRLTINAATTTSSPRMKITTDTWDPATATWLTQTILWVPAGLRFCQPMSSFALGTVTPTCPMPASGVDNLICFSPNGRVVTAGASTSCPTASSTSMSGATMFVSSDDGTKKFRIVIWGLTGMAKLMDTW